MLCPTLRVRIETSQVRAANVSMFGTDDLYPGAIIELAPDGRRFIVRYDGATPVRLREVT